VILAKHWEAFVIRKECRGAKLDTVDFLADKFAEKLLVGQVCSYVETEVKLVVAFDKMLHINISTVKLLS
jgi:hypothetical protein